MEGVSEDAVAEFVARWGLDDEACTALIESPPDVQARVLSSFQPKEGTRDVGRLFRGFLRSVSTGGVGGGGGGFGGGPCGGGGFARGSAPTAAQAFGMSSPSNPSTFGARGAPKGGYGSCGGWKGGGKGPGPSWAPQQAMVDPSAIQAFCAQWGLDDEAQRGLFEVDPATQARVIAEFAPKPGTRDVGRLFHGFLKSIRSSPPAQGSAPSAAMAFGGCGYGGGGCGKGAYGGGGGAACGGKGAKGGGGPSFAWGGAAPAFRGGGGGAYGGGAAAAAARSAAAAAEAAEASLLADLLPGEEADAASVQTVREWCAAFGLGDDCEASLLALDPSAQAQVMREFSPKAHTQDVSRLFHGFVRSVTGGGGKGGKGGGRDAFMGGGCGGCGGGGFKRAGYGFGGGEVTTGAGGDELDPPSAEDISFFIKVWGLDESCAAALEEHPPQVQRRVLSEFQPKPGTNDTQRLFHGFLRSLASGGGKRPRPSPRPDLLGAEQPSWV